MKQCKSCGESKPKSEFSPDKRLKDGLKSDCKKCLALLAKKSYDINKRRLWNSGWRSFNRHKFRFYRATRRSRQKDATPDWLTEDQLQQIKDCYWLAQDLEVVSGQKYHVDHIVPIQGKNVCGLHVPWNLQVLPDYLNMSKGNELAAFSIGGRAMKEDWDA